VTFQQQQQQVILTSKCNWIYRFRPLSRPTSVQLPRVLCPFELAVIIAIIDWIWSDIRYLIDVANAHADIGWLIDDENHKGGCVWRHFLIILTIRDVWKVALEEGYEQNMLKNNIKLKLLFFSVFRERVYHNKMTGSQPYKNICSKKDEIYF